MYAKQMRSTLSLILLFCVCSLSAETVYKATDEDGNITFTDKPSEEAEQIKIQRLDTIKNPNPGRYAPSSRQTEESDDNYESFAVTSPEDGVAVRSNNGNVSISLSLEPALSQGHKIIISMDGKEIGTGSNISLQNVDRGTHSISASVVDGNGKALISTSSTFSLLRVSQ